MRDGMKSNPEESLLRALAEFADETSLESASDRVRQTLRREVRAKARRRWAIPVLTAALAAAAALAAVLFGISVRSRGPAAPPPQTVARDRGASTPAPAHVATGAAPERLAASVQPSAAKRRAASGAVPVALSSRHDQGASPGAQGGEWRKGEVVLSPWYFNTALPPSARSVLVRSEVDARTAMRFGVASVGDTAPVEILFGEDGLPRAMRFVRHLPTQRN